MNNQKQQPEMAITYNADVGEFVVVHRGESGYTLAQGIYDKDHAKEVNARIGVTEEQRIAMELGSMFGWDAPAADPENNITRKMAQQNRQNGEEQAP